MSTNTAPLEIDRVRAVMLECRGVVSIMARRLSVGVDKVNKFLDRNPALREELELVRAEAKAATEFNPDLAEVEQVILAHDGSLKRIALYYGVHHYIVDDWFNKHPELLELARATRTTLALSTKASMWQPDPDAVVNALHTLNGNIGAVARQFRVARTTLVNYIQRTPEAQVALEEAQETMLDMAESSLYSRVLAGEAWAVCFFLKTRGRRRGYIERGETFALNVNLNNLTLAQLERLASGEHPSLVLGGSGRPDSRSADDADTIEGASYSRLEAETSG